MRSQRDLLLDLIEVHVGRIRSGHAEIKMEEVKRHLRQTHFAWMGGMDEDSAFYYRVHSPVIIVEFDHQRVKRSRNTRSLTEITSISSFALPMETITAKISCASITSNLLSMRDGKDWVTRVMR